MSSAFPENRLNLAMRDIIDIADIGDDISASNMPAFNRLSGKTK
jgi:hypothetical protein